ncbi:unnamed protein product [Polarella glacialis]|uniref:Uncharacterized protein n=1 Tax=Polarella glacialis TaxID=89957 RepID=A0A813DSW0_POLGL|nr:unnamed protein product [Polarella glacialis]
MCVGMFFRCPHQKSADFGPLSRRHLFGCWGLNVALTLAAPWLLHSFRYSPFYEWPDEVVNGMPKHFKCAITFLREMNASTADSLACGQSTDLDVCIVATTIRRPSNVSYVLPFVYSVARHMLQEPEEVRARACLMVRQGDDNDDLETIPAAWVRHAGDGERLKQWHWQENLDYAAALESCAAIGRHVLVLEDDLISQEGFLSHIFSMLDEHPNPDDLIIKLFKTDFYEGRTLHSAVGWVAGVLTLAFVVASVLARNVYLRLITMISISYLLVFYPLLMGAQHVLPVTQGLHKYTITSSCAILFSQRQARLLSAYLQDNFNTLAVDLLLGDYVKQQNAEHAAVWRPSLFQHVGLKTSSPDKTEECVGAFNRFDYASWFSQDSLFVEDISEEC